MISGGGWSASVWYVVCKAFTACSMPSSCTMLVYSEVTSIEHKRQPSGIIVASIMLIKSVVSLMNDGRFFIRGCSQMSTNCDMFSVALLTQLTMGLIPIGFL